MLGSRAFAQTAESTPPDDSLEATVRLCEVPNATIRETVRFELMARQEVVAACDLIAPVTLRIIFEDPLRGGFVEVRSGARTLQTRLPGPLDTLDDRAVALTAAALVEAVRSPAPELPPANEEGPDSVEVPEPVSTLEVDSDPREPDADLGPPEQEDADETLDEEPPAYVSYLDARHVFTLGVGLQNVGRHAAVAGGFSYGAMPVANIRVGTQVVFAFGKAYSFRLDLRGTYVWHHDRWTTELGAQVLGAVRIFDVDAGVELGGGGGLHGGATWYASDHFGFHLGAEVAAFYTRAANSEEGGAALEMTVWAGVRFGP